VYENIIFLAQSGWSYSEVSKFPIKKRDWLFETFVAAMKTDEITEDI